MPNLINNAASAFVFAVIGLLIFTVSFYLFDRVTPYHLWKEILEDQNVALAIVVGAVSIGISLIVAAAIHG